MKRLCGIWVLFFSLTGHGQRPIPSYMLSVTFKKTTNIIFPYRIEKADVGSPDVIGHKDQALQNVLFLKASRKNFTPTNLSVYTSDGKFYSFIVSYNENPDTLNISFIEDLKSGDNRVDSFMEARMDNDSMAILTQPSFLHRKEKTQDIKVVLNGIFLKDGLIWLRIATKNLSAINYLPVFIHFSIRDKKAGKRTAVQETEVPVIWSNAVKVIPGKEWADYLFAFASFTVPSEKKLVFQMEEKNGERTVLLEVPYHLLLKARVLQ